eukprot:PhF_6_TR4920/c0_g1_i1/m.6976
MSEHQTPPPPLNPDQYQALHKYLSMMNESVKKLEDQSAYLQRKLTRYTRTDVAKPVTPTTATTTPPPGVENAATTKRTREEMESDQGRSNVGTITPEVAPPTPPPPPRATKMRPNSVLNRMQSVLSAANKQAEKDKGILEKQRLALQAAVAHSDRQQLEAMNSGVQAVQAEIQQVQQKLESAQSVFKQTSEICLGLHTIERQYACSHSLFVEHEGCVIYFRPHSHSEESERCLKNQIQEAFEIYKPFRDRVEETLKLVAGGVGVTSAMGSRKREDDEERGVVPNEVDGRRNRSSRSPHSSRSRGGQDDDDNNNNDNTNNENDNDSSSSISNAGRCGEQTDED